MVSKDFVTAGRATFTVHNPRGEHYAYAINRRPRRNGNGDIYFVACNSGGADDRHGWRFLGILNPVTGTVALVGKTRFADTDVQVRVLRWALRFVWARHPLPTGYDIMHAGRCGRCAKQLTDPPSIERGIGPECIKKLAA